MRGDGRVFQRHRESCTKQAECGCVWRIAYYFRGKKICEAGEPGRPLRTEAEARKKLRAKIKAILGNRYVGPEEEKLLVQALLDSLLQNLELRGKSVRSFEPSIKTARKHFGLMRAVEMNPTVIERFQREELAAEKPKAKKTINHVAGVLRQAFRLAHKQGRISRVPHFPMLDESDNVRQGFVEPAQFEELLKTLPKHLADAAEFAGLTGWRKGQIAKLEWTHVDRTNRLLVVPGALTKNRKPQTLPLAGRLWDVIERRWFRREVKRRRRPVFLAPLVFHRGDGKPLGDIRKAWATACEQAEVPGLLFHDLRRSGVRNLIRAGVDPHVVMKISGHRTPSMLQRYNVIDTRDQLTAFEQLEKHLAKAPQDTNLKKIR